MLVCCWHAFTPAVHGLACLAGAVLFVISDSLLAINKFKSPFQGRYLNNANIWIGAICHCVRVYNGWRFNVSIVSKTCYVTHDKNRFSRNRIRHCRFNLCIKSCTALPDKRVTVVTKRIPMKPIPNMPGWNCGRY
jgi:hypothetical protein